MASTIYASFTNVELAEKAAGALLDHGVLKEDLSLVADSTNRQVQEVDGFTPVPNSAIGYSTPPGGQAFGATPIYPIDFTSTGYGNELPASGSTSFERSDVSAYDVSQTSPYGTNAVPDGTTEIDQVEAEAVAKSGITTTTAEDAGVGAIKGTGIGLGLGILAGLAVLVVPGVGLVLGGGALAAAVGAAASTTVAGAAVGGLVGYLKDQGIAETAAVNYNHAIGNGGALLAVSLPSNNVDLMEAEQVLNKYGAADISSY